MMEGRSEGVKEGGEKGEVVEWGVGSGE